MREDERRQDESTGGRRAHRDGAVVQPNAQEVRRAFREGERGDGARRFQRTHRELGVLKGPEEHEPITLPPHGCTPHLEMALFVVLCSSPHRGSALWAQTDLLGELVLAVADCKEVGLRARNICRTTFNDNGPTPLQTYYEDGLEMAPPPPSY